MELKGEAKLLRIFFGEDDKVGHKALYEIIVQEARSAGLAGATVWKGVLGFGATSRVRTTSILDLSTDLPLVLEIVDQEEKIDAFLPRVQELFEKADSGGLVTIEKVQILRYLHRKAERKAP
jgi:PII-like signaling protein